MHSYFKSFDAQKIELQEELDLQKLQEFYISFF